MKRIKEKEKYIYYLPERITINNYMQIRNYIKEDIEQQDIKTFILDFYDTVFIDSTGLGALIFIHKLALKNKKEIIVRNLSGILKDLFNLTGISDLFIIEGTFKEG